MSLILKNILLAFLWAILTGSITLPNLAFGFGIGFGILFLLHHDRANLHYYRTTIMAGGFLLYFLKELIVASVRVASDIVTPAHNSRPGVIAVPLAARTDLEITLLANLISLTPGTLSLDVSDDRKTLYIHAMFIDDPDALRREIKSGIERRLLAIMRGKV